MGFLLNQILINLQIFFYNISMHKEKISPHYKQKAKHSPEQIANSLINQVIYNIQNQICTSELIVNQKKEQFKLKKVQNKQEETSTQLKNLLEKKQKMQKELDLIEDQQKKIKSFSRVIQPVKTFKSQFTKEDAEKIKKLYAIKTQFEKSLQKKTKDYQKMVNDLEREKEELEMERKKQQSLERKAEILSRLNEISERQKNRKQDIEESNKSLAKIFKEKKLFQKLNEKWKTIYEEQIKKKEQIAKQNKQMRIVDFENIKQHEKKYDEIMKKQREQRNKRSTQMYNESVKTPSYFLNTVFMEDEKIKRQNQQRIKLQKLNLQRKQAFGQLVRVNYKPKVIKRSPLKDVQNSSSKQLQSLSVAQKYKQGTQFMRVANEKIVKQVKKHKKQQQPEKTEEYGGYSRYQDYLTSARIKRDPHQQQLSELQKIKNVLKSENTSVQQRFQKANMLAHRIEERNGNKSKNLVDSITAKIQIIKQLTY